MDVLQTAIQAAGGLAAMARAIGVSPQAVVGWREKQLPPDRVLDVSRACDWKVSPHRLAPHLYPHPDDGLPLWMRSSRDQESA